MLVKFTVLPAKTELYIRADMVLLVERDKQNPLQTLITTNIMTARGPLIYPVAETPDEVARLVATTMFEAAKYKSGIVLN